MNKWQKFKVFIARDYKDQNALNKVFDLGLKLIPLVEKEVEQMYFLHYCDKSTYKEGPHLALKVLNPGENFKKFINDLKKQGMDIEDGELEDEGLDDIEGSIAKNVFDKIKKVGKSNPIGLVKILKKDAQYTKLSKGRHYLHNMIQMTNREEKDFLYVYSLT